jgi:hypothetical protein
MSSKSLGTVIPSKASMGRGDKHSAALDRRHEEVAAPELPETDRRCVGGETRYYSDEAHYAVITRALKVRWFEVRPDGDWPARDVGGFK